jgi:anti-sigma factor RsiW
MTMHPSEIALNDYVDEALPPAGRADVDRHLESCAGCRAIVTDLRDLKRASSELPPLTPPERAWERIRADVTRQAGDARHPVPGGAARPRPAGGAALRTWLPAAAAVLLAVGGAWYFAARGTRPSSTPPAAASAPADAQAIEAELRQAEEHYQKAISGLERIANSEKGSLDPQTAATLQKNLSVVDQAIGESRAALRQQPTSEPAQQSLLENFRTKLALLEDTVALINEMRKGNETGAARIASGLKKKG